jgi:deoxyribodipyrimidine photo-lyase
MKRAVMWFRRDFRLADNPALSAAISYGKIIPVVIEEASSLSECEVGSASCWWRYQSLLQLNKSLDGRLQCRRGSCCQILKALIREHKVSAVFFNRRFEPAQCEMEENVIKDCLSLGVKVEVFNASLLWDPEMVLKKDGTPYKVFTPFYRRGCLQATPPREPLEKPKKIDFFEIKNTTSVDDLDLLPTGSWVGKWNDLWQIGEDAAQSKLNDFINNKIHAYKRGRDFPGESLTSRLSPHLHYGEVSVNQVWYAVSNSHAAKKSPDDTDVFLSELGWREFSYSLLYHFPSLPEKNWKLKFDQFRWENNQGLLLRWQQGKTGIPLVDAGMRELWQTGFMHNRVRMVVGSFLVKNCLIDWRYGAAWFADCLLDADLASNSQGWQWVAGSGVDAAPFFRIFNPVTQGKKFDPEGEYLFKYVPELSKLPLRFCHCPWEASTEVLAEAGVKLGVDYPYPMVDLKASRKKALSIYSAL